MRSYSAKRPYPAKEIYISFIAFLTAVLANTAANLLKGSIFYYLFYHGIFVLGICIIFPVWYIGIRSMKPLSCIGITNKSWLKAVLTGLLFTGVLIPGRIIGNNITLPGAEVLIYTTASLIMASLFEEVFFRGFLQTRFEDVFGMIPAIMLSGITFSVYHIGYRDFRDIKGLLVLIIIGIFFAISFRTTKNIITSFIVNLVSAIITFIEKKTFFDNISAGISLVVTVVSVIAIVIVYRKVNK